MEMESNAEGEGVERFSGTGKRNRSVDVRRRKDGKDHEWKGS